VAAARLRVLELLYESFARRHVALGSARAEAFRRFRAERGDALSRHALFEALQERLHRDDPAAWGWPVWPAEYRHPSVPAVARFAAKHRERIEFFEYLQWQSDLQLADAGRRARAFGIGLYQDLAVSIDRGGAEAWASQEQYAQGVSIGAPPDELNRLGQ